MKSGLHRQVLWSFFNTGFNEQPYSRWSPKQVWFCNKLEETCKQQLPFIVCAFQQDQINLLSFWWLKKVYTLLMYYTNHLSKITSRKFCFKFDHMTSTLTLSLTSLVNRGTFMIYNKRWLWFLQRTEIDGYNWNV